MSEPEPTAAIEAILASLESGRRLALARAISTVENQAPGFRDLLHALHAKLGRAQRVGITGPPGAGKSTLVAALVAHYRSRAETVGVIAVDPTSPFTGGALLGDRIRMTGIVLDDGVFIRSMATRGSVGGLALTTEEVADVMDAFGFDRVLIETVGVGQTELDIAAAADTTVVVLVPESGDGIQAMKAGLMEVSDLFVVNKADRPGADRMARELSMMLHLRSGRVMRTVPAHHGVDLSRVRAEREQPLQPAGPAAWEVPVLQTIAETGSGVGDLADALDRHFRWLNESGERDRRRRERWAERVRNVANRALRETIWQQRSGDAWLEHAAAQPGALRRSPYAVADEILNATVGDRLAGAVPDEPGRS